LEIDIQVESQKVVPLSVDGPPKEALAAYGSLVPFHHSPYFNQTHATLRDEVRQWVEENVEPNLNDQDKNKFVPPEIYQDMGKRGYLAGLLGMNYPVEYTPYRVPSVLSEKWDPFHEFIITDEISRSGSGGFVWNMIGGYGIGREANLLAITEPEAGSDVANLTCEAKKTSDRKHFIVNGEKKWITNGILSDYFTVAVRTGGPGIGGISVLLIECSEGVIWT
ncbi:hypothetical protein RUND412_002712, partial [Rhizina undulata]